MYRYILPCSVLILLPLAFGEGSITYIDNPSIIPSRYIRNNQARINGFASYWGIRVKVD